MIGTIDQLLRYVTWRDTKTAILIFSKKKDLVSVVAKACKEIKQHKNYKSEYDFNDPSLQKAETIFGYKFSHPSDVEKQLYLALMVFQISGEEVE